MVREAGAREIHFRVSSPPITGPCHYGIDTPTRAELIAATHDLEEIRRHLGVETLGYLSQEGMRRAVGAQPWCYCDACFTGCYPTPTPDATEPAPEPVQLAESSRH
jgi:amidophosphoribosyltransferase